MIVFTLKPHIFYHAGRWHVTQCRNMSLNAQAIRFAYQTLGKP